MTLDKVETRRRRYEIKKNVDKLGSTFDFLQYSWKTKLNTITKYQKPAKKLKWFSSGLKLGVPQDATQNETNIHIQNEVKAKHKEELYLGFGSITSKLKCS